MIHFFHSENFFARIAWKFSQLLLLNVLLLFFSLPLFTIGAAITAGSKVALSSGLVYFFLCGF